MNRVTARPDGPSPASTTCSPTRRRPSAAPSARFLDERVEPYVADWFERGEIDDVRGLTKELGALGLLGMHLEGYGCAGMSAVDYGLACLELEATDSGVRSLVSVQGSLAMFAIHRWGTEEHRERWLPPMAAGEAIGCFGLTEPDHGSDPASMRTRARRDGDDWVLDGSKMWITNGSIADVAVVWAQTRDEHGGSAASSCPPTAPGFSAPRDQAQAVAARLGDQRAGARRRAAAGRRGAPRGARPQGPAVLPQRGPLRHRLGVARRGPVEPRHGPPLRHRAATSSAARSRASS